jgi:hypothetical protein
MWPCETDALWARRTSSIRERCDGEVVLTCIGGGDGDAWRSFALKRKGNSDSNHSNAHTSSHTTHSRRILQPLHRAHGRIHRCTEARSPQRSHPEEGDRLNAAWPHALALNDRPELITNKRNDSESEHETDDCIRIDIVAHHLRLVRHTTTSLKW